MAFGNFLLLLCGATQSANLQGSGSFQFVCRHMTIQYFGGLESLSAETSFPQLIRGSLAVKMANLKHCTCFVLVSTAVLQGS